MALLLSYFAYPRLCCSSLSHTHTLSPFLFFSSVQCSAVQCKLRLGGAFGSMSMGVLIIIIIIIIFIHHVNVVCASLPRSLLAIVG